MTAQGPIPAETFAYLAKLGFVAVKDRDGAISFVQRRDAAAGVKKGYYTLVPPPDDGVTFV